MKSNAKLGNLPKGRMIRMGDESDMWTPRNVSMHHPKFVYNRDKWTVHGKYHLCLLNLKGGTLQP